MYLSAKFFIAAFLTSIFLCPLLLSQDIGDKLDDIKGKVEKITVTTEEGEFTFEGEDAAKLLKRIKSSSNNFVWHSAEKDGKKKIVFLDSDDKEHHVKVFGDEDDELIIISEDADTDIEGITKKVEVEVENGDKKVTVTTKENGEEKTEVYEGDEADKYIQEMKEKHGGDMEFYFEKDDDGKVKKKRIIIEKETVKESQ